MNEPNSSETPRRQAHASQAKKDHEAKYQAWCKDTGHDPEEEASREAFTEIDEEYGNSFWDDMDPNDRVGWEHNIAKDSEG